MNILKKVDMKETIKNRNYNAELKDEHSFLDYHIVASRKIIQRMLDMLRDIEEEFSWK